MTTGPRLVVPIDVTRMSGGMPRSVHLLLRYLSHDIEALVLAPYRSEVAGAIRSLRIPVIETPKLENWVVTWKQPLPTIKTLRVVRPIIRDILTDNSIIVTNNVPAELLCGLGAPFRRVPRVFVHRGFEYTGLLHHTLKRSLLNCTAFVATSAYQQRLLTDQLTVTPQTVHLIPNGVSMEDYGTVPTLARPHWHRPGLKYIGVLGTPSPNKNQELLIRAVALLRTAGLPVVGVICGSPKTDEQGRYLTTLKTLAVELGVGRHCLFLPYHDDPRPVYAGLDIVVSTSKKEGFGRTIVEAMAARRAVVALCAGGPETVIQHGNTGLLVTRNDPADFAVMLRCVLENDHLRKSLTDRGYQAVVTHYSATSIAQQYAKLFYSVWEAHKPRTACF